MKKIKTGHLMRKLVKMIDQKSKYPVSYIISQDGTKIIGERELLGADLTENQIFELWESGILKTKTNAD